MGNVGVAECPSSEIKEATRRPFSIQAGQQRRPATKGEVAVRGSRAAASLLNGRFIFLVRFVLPLIVHMFPSLLSGLWLCGASFVARCTFSLKLAAGSSGETQMMSSHRLHPVLQ
jgi:hypothetical protein